MTFYSKIMRPLVIVGGILLTSCDDQIMEWGTPEGHGTVTASELPLEVKEVLANYDNLKAYAPDGFVLGLGFGAANYVGDDARRALADQNFQMITWGNAMKHDALVGNTGSLSASGLATLDAALDAMPTGMQLWGHNFFWHTQQNQGYLRTLIKPQQIIESDSDIKNLLGGDASNFDGGTTGGWGSWGSNKESVDVAEGAGPDGSPAAVLVNKGDGNAWEAQFAYTFDTPLQPDAEYTLRFKAKSNSASGQLQFQYQNGTTYGSQGGYTTFDVGTSWQTFEAKITVTPDDANRIIFNFGAVGGTYTLDDIEFGFQEDNPMDLIVSSDFEDGTTQGWGSWGGNKDDAGVADGEGVGKSKALMLRSKADGDFWQAQCAYTLADGEYLSPDGEYTIRFKARSVSGKGQLQFQYQNGTTYGSQGAYTTFDVASSWTQCETTFTPQFDDVNRIIINFGAVGDTYYVDDIEFGTMKASDPMENILFGDASDFEGGTSEWGSWGGNKESADVVAEAAHSGSYGLRLVNKGDGDFWQAQCAYTLADGEYLMPNSKYIIQFYARSNTSAGQLQFQYQNGTTYGSQGAYTTFDVGTEWALCQTEFVITDFDDVNRIIINFGKVGGTYDVDDIKFGVAKDQDAAAARSIGGPRRAARTYYILKSAEEKREALLGAMESWVKAISEHLADKGITPYGYDVINEAITDGGGNKVRGVDGVFGMSGDSEPTESEAEGLSLNWEDGHFYYGYYVKDYPVQAFQLARKYLPAETKLFYNDYNLETSDSKRAAAIQFVKDIDAANGSPIVDGIGTQMHVAINPTDDATNNAAIVATWKERVDKQFQELAATGKLVRVTELDVDMCSYDANGERKATDSPSSAQYKCQADIYEMIIQSYLQNVPASQRSGITIWSLTDAEDEHTYWLEGGKPNLFDDQNKRKWAYKGAADGLAGEDLGLKYGGEDYKAFYERQNVSDTVK